MFSAPQTPTNENIYMANICVIVWVNLVFPRLLEGLTGASVLLRPTSGVSGSWIQQEKGFCWINPPSSPRMDLSHLEEAAGFALCVRLCSKSLDRKEKVQRGNSLLRSFCSCCLLAFHEIKLSEVGVSEQCEDLRTAAHSGMRQMKLQIHICHLCDFSPQIVLHIVSVINTLQQRPSEGQFRVFGISRTKSVSKIFI